MLLAFFFVLGFVYSQILYPPQQNQYIQWTQQGAWLDCQTNQPILAQNCNSNDTVFSECYQIPSNGICSQELKNLMSPLYLDVKIKAEGNFTISVGDTYKKKISFSSQLNRILLEIPSIKKGVIQIKGGKAGFLLESYLKQNKIEVGCVNYDDKQFRCLECDQQKYFMYQGHCLLMEYLAAQSSISNGFNTTFTQMGDSIYALFQDLDGDIPKTLVPRIYYLKDLTNPIIVGYADPSQIQLIAPDKLQLQIGIDSIRKTLPCQNYEIEEQYVSECIISLALTLESVTQFQQISLMRMVISKEISSEVVIQPQSFTPPDQCCGNESIGLLGKARILNYYTIGSKNYIIAIQQIVNPNFANYLITFKSATLTTQDGMELSLVLDRQNGTTQSVVYTLWYPSTLNIDLQTSKLYVESSLVSPSSRILEESKSSLFSNVNFHYFMGQVAKFDNNSLQTLKNSTTYQRIEIFQPLQQTQNNNWLLGFFVLNLLILVFFITKYTRCKYRKEALANQVVEEQPKKQLDNTMKEQLSQSPVMNKYFDDEKQVEIKANSNSNFEEVVIMQE